MTIVRSKVSILAKVLIFVRLFQFCRSDLMFRRQIKKVEHQLMPHFLFLFKFYKGIFPCFLAGLLLIFVWVISNAWINFSLVCEGRMISST